MVLLIGTAEYLQAQKIKYKDLYFLLDTRKYDDAEPFLREFIRDPKNSDHANAHFQMAVIYQEKIKKNDVLQETDILNSNIDSAVIFYQKALSLIDEKEVKRNDEFYQAYKRRDIRTGKFGIKLADIQFDIEKKVDGLKSQKTKITELKGFYEQMKEKYSAAHNQYTTLQTEYPTKKVLFLRSDNKLIEAFNALKKDYLEAVENFDKYKSALGKVSNSGYDQSLHQKEILDYQNDGASAPDYLADNIDFWDFSSWVDQATVLIRETIFPMREQMIVYDQELKRLHSKMITDSVPVTVDISMLPYSRLNTQLKQFDEEPLPMALFDLRIADLKYNSALIQEKDYKDSVDVVYQLEVVGKALNKLNEMDSLVNILVGKNLTEESKNYKQYVDTQFGSEVALQAYVKEKLDFVIDQNRAKKAEFEQIVERSRWLIAQEDSIPLFDARKGEKFVPLDINDKTTSGLYFSGETAAQGYFAVVERSRIPEVNVKFDVNSEYFNRENIENISAMSISDEAGQIHFVVLYIPKPEQEAYAAVVSKIYASDGLAWTKNIDLATAPVNFVYNQGAGDFVIEYDQQSGTSEDSPEFLILDKKGNVKQ